MTCDLQEFVTGLSVLSRGTLEEKLKWTFSLYDINGDGYITKEEMTEIVTAIYDLMGKIVEPMIDDEAVREKVERMFQVHIKAYPIHVNNLEIDRFYWWSLNLNGLVSI